MPFLGPRLLLWALVSWDPWVGPVIVTEVLETDQMPYFSLSWCISSLVCHRLLRFWALAPTWGWLEWQSVSWQGSTNGRYSEGSSSQERFTERLCVRHCGRLGSKSWRRHGPCPGKSYSHRPDRPTDRHFQHRGQVQPWRRDKEQ